MANCIYTLIIMNMEAFMNDFASKPKINRLPLPIAQDREAGGSSSDSYVIWSSLGSFALLSVLVLIFIVYQYGIGLSEVAKVSADDVHLMSLVNSTDENSKRDGSSLYFKDEGGVLVGQTVKIASGSEVAVSNTANGNDDKATGQGLLAILSKY